MGSMFLRAAGSDQPLFPPTSTAHCSVLLLPPLQTSLGPHCRQTPCSLLPKVPKEIWRLGDNTVLGKDRTGTQGAILQPPKEMMFPVETHLHAPGAQPAAQASLATSGPTCPRNLHWEHGTGIRMLKALSQSGASQHPEMNHFASGWSSILQVWESVGQGAANSHLVGSFPTQTIP